MNTGLTPFTRLLTSGKIRRYAVIMGMLISAVLVCYVVYVVDRSSGYTRREMQAMIKRAQRQFSPVALQAAVAPLCARYPNYNSDVPVGELPREILSLSDARPGLAMILTGDRMILGTNQPPGMGTLHVLWGGGFGSWGVGVCPPGGQLDTNVAAHVWRWNDGVFFFYQ